MLWKRHIPGYELWNRLRYRREHPALERDVFGIHFRHPVGLAPVLERQVELLDECDDIGFCFTGVIPGETPVQAVAERLQARISPIVVSVELRAEGDEEEKAQRSLIRQFSLLYDFTDYFVIDINRESGLSSLDDLSDWTPLLDEILNLRLCYEKYRPILLRIAPGHTEEQMARILDFCLISGFDGVVAPGIAKVRFCAEYTKNRLPIIGSGAIATTDEAIALLQAGASLIEVARGLKNKGLYSAKRLLQAIDNPPTKS
jgi:dihydroorotate dehydrogenase